MIMFHKNHGYECNLKQNVLFCQQGCKVAAAVKAASEAVRRSSHALKLEVRLHRFGDDAFFHYVASALQQKQI